MNYSSESYVHKLSGRIDNGLINVITGSGRAGKSYLMNNLFYQCFWIWSYVDPRYCVSHSIRMTISIF